MGNRGGQEGNKNAEKWTEEKALELGNEMIEWLKKDGNVFYGEFLSVVKDLYPNTISYLEGKFESFLYLKKKAQKIQEFKLLNKGLNNEVNPTITIFTLKNHHNYKDKSEVDQTITEKKQIFKIGDNEFEL